MDGPLIIKLTRSSKLENGRRRSQAHWVRLKLKSVDILAIFTLLSYFRQVADAAKVLSNGDNIPKILDGCIDLGKDVTAPPSTPTREEETDAVETKKKAETYPHFPRFRVTWDSTKPSLMSLKSPGKKKHRRSSQSGMAVRPSVLM